MKGWWLVGSLVVLGILLWGVEKYGDYGLTVITENHQWREEKDTELALGSEVWTKFRAKHNKLGIVAVKFDTHNRMIDDVLEFGIREEGGEWHYLKKYKTDQFRNMEYFPFGFPEIDDSKGKEYEVVIRSVRGEIGKTVGLVARDDFLSKYSFSKSYLIKHSRQIIFFVWGKFGSFWRHVEWWIWPVGLGLVMVGWVVIRVGLSLVRNREKLWQWLLSEGVGRVATGIVFVALFICLWWIIYFQNMRSQYGDTTFAAQLMMSAGKNFGYESSFSRSLAYVFHDVFYKSADYVCHSKLMTTKDFNPWGHFYLIVFVVGWITGVMNIFMAVAFWQALIYTFILWFSYAMSRKLGLSRICSLLVMLIVWQHPLWRQGVWGQFYYNRFFLLFSGLCIWFLTEKKLSYWLVGISSLLAVLCNEIYGIALAMIFAVNFFLFKKNKTLLLFGFAALLVGLVLTLTVQKTAEPGLTQNLFFSSMLGGGLVAILRNFGKVIMTEETVKFLLINFVYLGLVVWKRPKVFLAWLFLLTPNMLIYVGKLGWSTHYHMSYFLPLIWMFTYSIATFSKKGSLGWVLILVWVVVSKFVPEQVRFEGFSPTVVGLVKVQKALAADRKNIRYRFDTLRSKVNVDDWISLPEAIAYNFVDHKISYYPADIDLVDKVILFYDASKKGRAGYYSINYGQQEDGLDRCILERMKKNGFEVDKPVIFESWVIFSKKNDSRRSSGL